MTELHQQVCTLEMCIYTANEMMNLKKINDQNPTVHDDF